MKEKAQTQNTDLRPKSHIFRAMMIGVATFVVVQFAGISFPIYKNFFPFELNTVSLLIAWWFIFFLLPQFSLNSTNSLANTFFMTICFGFSAYLLNFYKEEYIGQNPYAFFIGLGLGILMIISSIKQSRTEDKYLKTHHEKISLQIRRRYRTIAFIVSISLLFVGFLVSFIIVDKYSKENLVIFAFIILAFLFGIGLLIILVLNMKFGRALFQFLTIELNIVMAFWILGLNISVFHKFSSDWYTSEYIYIGPFERNLIFVVLIVLSYNIGNWIEKIPNMMNQDTMLRMQRRHLRKLARWERRYGIKFSGIEEAKVTNNYTLLKSNNEFEEIVEENSSHRPSPVQINPPAKNTSLKKKLKLSFNNIQDYEELQIALKTKIHVFLNGGWYKKNAFIIPFSLSFLWISLYAMNFNQFRYFSAFGLILGLLTILSVLLLFLIPDNFNFTQIFKAEDRFQLGIVGGILLINIVFSMALPNFIFFLLVPELFLIAPFLGVRLKKYQEFVYLRDSTDYDLFQFFRLILWELYVFFILINPNQNILVGIGLGLFVVFSIVYYGFTLGWKKSPVVIVLEFLIYIGLSFMAVSLRDVFYADQTIWVVSCILSIPFMFFSGFLFQIIYFRVKIHFLDKYPEMTQNAKAEILEYVNRRTESEIVRSAIHPEKIQETTQILDNVQEYNETHEESLMMSCPICQEHFPLDEEELRVLRTQNYIFCPNCQERVSINEILEPSFKSLIMEHRKVIQDMEKKKKAQNGAQDNSNLSVTTFQGR